MQEIKDYIKDRVEYLESISQDTQVLAECKLIKNRLDGDDKEYKLYYDLLHSDRLLKKFNYKEVEAEYCVDESDREYGEEPVRNVNLMFRRGLSYTFYISCGEVIFWENIDEVYENHWDIMRKTEVRPMRKEFLKWVDMCMVVLEKYGYKKYKILSDEKLYSRGKYNSRV